MSKSAILRLLIGAPSDYAITWDRSLRGNIKRNSSAAAPRLFISRGWVSKLMLVYKFCHVNGGDDVS